jgi:sarcosine oxidase subunit beta
VPDRTREAQGTPEETHPDFLWRNPEPKRSYEAVVVGGGLHGLATAYYLARNHGLTDVAVVERGWLGSGNAVRNTTVVRSNYLREASVGLYDHAVTLWETLGEELDYDILFDQRGVLNLAHDEHEVKESLRRLNSNRLSGVDSEWLTPEEVQEFCPIIDVSAGGRYPVLGATLQRRGGTARHDAVVFALARAADSLGVDLLQGCEVTGIDVQHGRVTGLQTSRGAIAADRVGLCAAGHSSLLAGLAGFDVPIQSYPLQALVSELFEQVLGCVVMSVAVHVYVSQAQKGELVMGAGRDSYNSYAQRGSFHVIEDQMAAAVALFPMFASAHVLRTWAGIVDVSPDASPIVGLTPVENLFINCGWGTGGFKATPGSGWVYAHTIATGRPHPLNEPFSLERFETGAIIAEHGATGIAH